MKNKTGEMEMKHLLKRFNNGPEKTDQKYIQL